MKSRKTIICITTILLIMISLFFFTQETEIPFSFVATTEAGSETIHYWQREDGECFVFLPSYLELDHLRIHAKKPVFFDDLKLSYGMTCEEIAFNHTYALSGWPGYPERITFLQSEKLPAMYIDTASGGLDFIHDRKGVKEAGELRLYSTEGSLEHTGRLEFIKARGNSTFWADKKPYSLKLATEADLLGMGKAAKWILLANAYDPTNLRNKVVFDFAREAGLPYSPESDWVDLYLNGQYVGLYLLCERNEVHPQRVALQENQGWLVSKVRQFARSEETPITDAQVPLRVWHSSMDEGSMMEIIQSAENAILSPDGVDPETGKHWTDLIDLDSWSKKYLIEEIFGGIDGGVSSQFFYYHGNEPGGKIYAGPVWDYDATVPTDSYPRIFYAHRTKECPWFHSLYYNDRFYSRI